jgi:hypothetical protein
MGIPRHSTPPPDITKDTLSTTLPSSKFRVMVATTCLSGGFRLAGDAGFTAWL